MLSAVIQNFRHKLQKIRAQRRRDDIITRKVQAENIFSEEITDENFHDIVDLWFENEKECRCRFGHISVWDTSRVTNMRRAFCIRENFNEDISSWDVSHVTNMSGMFHGASQFNGDLSRWDVSNVTNMNLMFFDASQFNGDLIKWDVSNVKEMHCMFFGAIQFDGDLSHWDFNLLW
jgi:surface protein